jgi:hypothetical protein
VSRDVLERCFDRDTFAGIAPSSVPAFFAAQMVGMLIALRVARRLWSAERG